ncbi:junctophilin-1 [Salmo trutta]|uniref:junctophilin-1 n=1 Tax=Salmo trutta TaxID=8032 RepID=UPI001130ACB3|nr:junctophilin-1-like [Salmo trutta]
MDPVEIPKDPPEEKEKDRPASPAKTPGPTPPPSPHSKKRQHSNSVSTSSSSRKTSKDESSHGRKVSKEEKPVRKSSKEERSSRKLSKEERVSIAAEPPTAAAPSSHVIHQEASAKSPKAPEAGPTSVPPPQAAAPQTVVGPGNGMGQLHSQYHSYYVKAPSRGPLPPEPEPEEDEEPSQLTLARMAPPPPKSFRNFTLKPTPTGEQSKLRKQDSLKPKSLAETKKASMEMADGQGEENAPNSILVAMVMLLNIGLAIIFVHFLT